MAKKIAFLDCCSEPVLETVKVLHSTVDEVAERRCCQNCKGQWYYRMKEYHIASDDLNRRAWYVRLTPKEVEILEKSTQPLNETLFSGKPGFVRDEDGVNKVEGIPYFLQSGGMCDAESKE